MCQAVQSRPITTSQLSPTPIAPPNPSTKFLQVYNSTAKIQYPEYQVLASTFQSVLPNRDPLQVLQCGNVTFKIVKHSSELVMNSANTFAVIFQSQHDLRLTKLNIHSQDTEVISPASRILEAIEIKLKRPSEFGSRERV
eukprot:512944_1